MILIGYEKKDFDAIVRERMAADASLSTRDFIHVTRFEQLAGLELKPGRDEVMGLTGELRRYAETRWR